VHGLYGRFGSAKDVSDMRDAEYGSLDAARRDFIAGVGALVAVVGSRMRLFASHLETVSAPNPHGND
jgi:hypothetical protein